MPRQTAYEELLRLARTGAAVIQVTSHEWERIQGLAIQIGQDLSFPVEVWSRPRGLWKLKEEQLREDGLNDPLELLRWLEGREDEALVVMEDFHPFLAPDRGNDEQIRRLRELARPGRTPRLLLLLSTPIPGLPIELRKEIPEVELPLPGPEDLEQVCQRVGHRLGKKAQPVPALLDAARGLTVMEADLAFGQAAVELGRLDASAVGFVAREKKRVIRQSEVLEYFEPDRTLEDVGGLDRLKQWLEQRGRAYTPGAREYGLDTPKGVLLLGVQGCGKSLIAKSIASTWQFPLLRFDVGKVYGSLIGQSEASMREALKVTEAIAPCVLWIDEIEKGLSGLGSSGQTDGGTSARVVGSLLTWMQERSAPVFVVATANRVDQLPPELMRKGRFDEIFFVDLPSRNAREAILGIHLKRKGRKPEDFDLARLASASLGYSGAELEEAVREGLFRAFAESVEVKDEHIESALKDTYPLSRTMREEIEALRKWARVRARSASADEAEALPEADKSTPRLRQEWHNPFVPASEGK